MTAHEPRSLFSTMITHSLVPSHAIADRVVSAINITLDTMGLDRNPAFEDAAYIIIISAISLGIGYAVKNIILYITKKAVEIHATDIGRRLLAEGTLTKCSHIIPPLIFMVLTPIAFSTGSEFIYLVLKIVGVYALICLAIGLCAILTFIFNRYNDRENTRNLPIKGLLNVAKGIVWIVILVIAVSILVSKSPGTLLAGLGAFAAALMLIFKDSILGFVAGIQMSENDMLHVGDWIVVPGTPANGTVIDVSLSTVKVRNFDMTLVMVPPYTLVSTSFRNYRGMYDAGARRIKRSLLIDIPTIKTADNDMMNVIVAKHPEMGAYINNLHKSGQTAISDPGKRPENGTLETNLGLFRAYISIYLMAHSKIAKDQRILVRILEATPNGLPLEIWCFTATTNWNEYEGIQSEVIEHLTGVIDDFGELGIYTASSVTVDTTDKPSHYPSATPSA